MTTTSIRAISEGDRSGWETLWHGYLDFYKTKPDPAVTDITWQRLLNPEEDPHGFVAATPNGEIFGLVHYMYHRSTWSVGSSCYLQDLYVLPELRGQGFGRKLIEAVYSAASEAGACQVYWLTQEGNKDARILYDKIGELTDFIKYRHTLLK